MRRIAFACAALLALISLQVRASDEGKEEKLEEEPKAAFLKSLGETFAAQTYLRATVERVVEDPLFGEIRKKGEFLLKRPDTYLRKYEGAQNTHEVAQLKGTEHREFNPSTKKVDVLDFSKAPKKLDLMRAAMVGDIPVLQKHFDIHVHKSNGEKPQYRLVFLPKSDSDVEVDWKRVVGVVDEGAPFFKSVQFEYEQGKGTTKTEYFSEFKTPDAIEAREFEDSLLDTAKKEVTKVKDAK